MKIAVVLFALGLVLIGCSSGSVYKRSSAKVSKSTPFSLSLTRTTGALDEQSVHGVISKSLLDRGLTIDPASTATITCTCDLSTTFNDYILLSKRSTDARIACRIPGNGDTLFFEAIGSYVTYPRGFTILGATAGFAVGGDALPWLLAGGAAVDLAVAVTSRDEVAMRKAIQAAMLAGLSPSEPISKPMLR